MDSVSFTDSVDGWSAGTLGPPYAMAGICYEVTCEHDYGCSCESGTFEIGFATSVNHFGLFFRSTTAISGFAPASTRAISTFNALSHQHGLVYWTGFLRTRCAHALVYAKSEV